MTKEEQLLSIRESIEDPKLLLIKNQVNTISDKWIPWNDAKVFFDYGPTQMSAMEKNHDVLVTKVGRRKYIHRDSIIS